LTPELEAQIAGGITTMCEVQARILAEKLARFVAAFVLLGLALVWLAVRIAEVRLSLWGVASLIVTFAVGRCRSRGDFRVLRPSDTSPAKGGLRVLRDGRAETFGAR
jgi:hypothetical protein